MRWLRATQWWGPVEGAVLLLVAPFLLFTTPARAILLLVLPALWGLRRLLLGRFVPATPVNLLVLLLLLSGGVGFCVSPNPTWSQLKINELLLGVGFLYATVDALQAAGRWHWVPVGVLAITTGFLSLGLLGTRWGLKIPQLTTLVAGLPGRVGWLPEGEASFNPNVIGGALLWVLPLHLSLFWWAVRRRARRWAIVQALLATLSLALLVLTQARGAWLGFAASGLTLLAVAGGRLGRIGAILLLAALVALVAFGPPALRLALQVDGQSTRILSTISFEQRLEIWSRAQYAIADFPFTGPGLDAFQYVMPVMYPLFQAPPGAAVPHAHNEFLQVALDLGLPGLVAWLALYVAAFWMLGQTYRRSADHTSPPRTSPPRSGRTTGGPMYPSAPTGDSLIQALALGSGGALIAHLGYAMTDCAVLDAKPNVVFWMVIGLSVALYQAQESADGETDKRIIEGP